MSCEPNPEYCVEYFIATAVSTLDDLRFMFLFAFKCDMLSLGSILMSIGIKRVPKMNKKTNQHASTHKSGFKNAEKAVIPTLRLFICFYVFG